MKTIERRMMAPGELRLTKNEDGTQTLVGYAARFNVWSEDLGWFKEKIAPGAFKSVLKDDVRNLFNHDPNFITGRTKSGTLRLKEDKKGLYKEVDLPDTQVARDLAISVERGDITGQSFGFTVKRDEWEENHETGETKRTIVELEKLFDVSDVTFPAYPDTDVALRSLTEWRGENNKPAGSDDPGAESPDEMPSHKVEALSRGRSLSIKMKKAGIKEVKDA